MPTMSRLFHRLLPFLTILVMGFTQVFGVQQGYFCTHQAQPEEMTAEHCHQEEEGERVINLPCQDLHCDQAANGQNTEHHTPVTTELKSGTFAFQVITAPAFAPVVLTDLPEWSWTWLVVPVEVESGIQILGRPPDTAGDMLHRTVQLAKSMVLLV